MVKTTLIITLVTLAVINDLYNYRINNAITYSFAIIGLFYSLLYSGHVSFYSAILGLAIPFMILLPLYITKMFGAGDIKLFCALGAFIGLRLVLISIVYSFITGAVIALIIMIIRKNALLRFKYFFGYIKCCFLCMAVLPYCDINAKDDGTKMHFTIPIALGTTMALLLKV